MTIEDKLKEYILSKYKSIRAFTQEADIPYSTVDTMFKRGLMGMSVQNVIKLCHALNIDVDKLADGLIEPIKRNIALDANEFNLVNQYREIDEHGKQLLLTVASHEYNRCQKQRTQENNHNLILSTVAARSAGNSTKIHTEYIEDLSKYTPDDTDL